MTPGARIQTAIDLLDRIDAPPKGKEAVPADTMLAGYFRGRRYIGSGDRRSIYDLVYGVLRNRAKLDWWLGADAAGNNRRRVIAYLAAAPDRSPSDLRAAFDGGQYRPAPLDADEDALTERMRRRLDSAEQPVATRAEIPEWLADELAEAFGAALLDELGELARPGHTDLRVNALKAGREAVRARLAADGVEAADTPISPLGLRIPAGTPLGRLAAHREGLVEVQDEGSQIVALLADARPGMDVLDYCAGAGGKTLALAAAMGNSGRLVAADIYAVRLTRMAPRLERAGAAIVETVALSKDGAGLGERRFERVLVDAPCSGSGAWRRNPEAKWRLTPERLDALVGLQRNILDRAARHVKPGGRLVYATCSILPCENERQMAWFMESHAGFAAIAAGEAWAAAGLPADFPAPPDTGHWLQLTPRRHGTDGFFVATLERTA